MDNKLLLPEKTADLTPVQQGWIKLAGIKTDCFDSLQKSELAVQGFLTGHEEMDLEKIQVAIKDAKNEAANAKDRRLHFTKMLDEKLIQPAMAFEKRNEELIATASKKELELRKVAAAELEKVNAKNREAASLEAHIKNEFERISKNYRNAISKTISEMYAKALTQKVKVKDIPAYIEDCIQAIAGIVLEKPVKFTRNLVKDEEAKAVLSKITKYDSKVDFEAAINRLKTETFAMYAEDLKNGEQAAAAAMQKSEEEIAANNEEWNLEAATNTLMAQATPLEMTGGPVVKKQQKIILEDTEQFAMKVLATFIKNWPEASKKIGVKSWTKLVDPFVKALDKMDTQFNDFKYEEICK
jgi:hypothetical protein